MFTEYIWVRFPDERDVCVDTKQCGVTNQVIRVDAGMHTVTLSGSSDYQPRKWEGSVQGTTPYSPLKITFEKSGRE